MERGRDSCFLRFQQRLVYSILSRPCWQSTSFLFITISSSSGCGNCGKLGRVFAEFSKRGRNGGKHAVRFPRFPRRGSFHSLGVEKALSAKLGKKLGHILPPPSFWPPPNGMAWSVVASFRLNRPGPSTLFWCANCAARTSGRGRDEAIDQAWR